ncbi:HORMA domain containing protein [Gracilaria domingensis]|nr:HORMA domain containing protein [Gracilaria domingensis]
MRSPPRRVSHPRHRSCFDEQNFIKSKIGDTHFYKLKIDCAGNAARYRSWLAQGVYDALARKYLSVVRIEIYKHSKKRTSVTRKGKKSTNSLCSSDNLLECYAFHITYSGEEAQLELSVKDENDVRTVNVQEGCSEMLSRLMEITEAMEGLPSTHIVSVKLLIMSVVGIQLHFTEDTPDDYQPPLFKRAQEDAWFVGDTIDLVAGNVKTPFHSLKMQVYARNTEEHRKKLLPLTHQANGGISAEEKAEIRDVEEIQESEQVGEALEDHIPLPAVTLQHTPLPDNDTVRNDSDEDILEDINQDVGGSERVKNTLPLNGTQPEVERQYVLGTARMSGTQPQTTDAPSVDEDCPSVQQIGEDCKLTGFKKLKTSRLPPLLRQRDRDVMKMAPTQDSDFEATQVKRGGKRKTSEVERHVVVRKRAKGAR